MKKLKSKAGMTLMEIMVSLLIMTLLVVGMGTGMNTGMRVYNDASFEAESASLAGILNTALGDMLRYAQVRTANADGTTPIKNAAGDSVDFVFTNLEYGVRDVSFSIVPTPQTDDGGRTVLVMKSLDGTSTTDLINTGAYPDLSIKSFKSKYYPPASPGTTVTYTLTFGDGTSISTTEGGFFHISYDVIRLSDSNKTHHAETVVRLMNAE